MAAESAPRRPRRRRVVLTGPPGSGKTTILRGLAAAGITTVGEAATDVIAELQEVGIAEPWLDLLFPERVAAQQRERQLAADASGALLAVYDRSPVCTLALARYLGHPVGPALARELARIVEEALYDRRVLYVEPIGRVVSTAARRIDYEESLAFGELHRAAYAQHGFRLVRVPAGPPRQRVSRVLAVLGARTDTTR